jgi:sialate O-acetylesterase
MLSTSLFLALLAAAAHSDSAALRPAKIFADGMVIQRERADAVWGTAHARARVTVSFRGHSSSTSADALGNWRVAVQGGKAGGPFELAVSSGGERVVFHDVLVGDVWFASGQSNMEFTLAGARNAQAEIAAAHDSMIRQFKVPLSWDSMPAHELQGGSWAPADPTHAGAFSAVAYFFARELRATTHVPIGIVNSTWGGSAIESWLSGPAQGYGANAWNVIHARVKAKDDSALAALKVLIPDWPQRDAGLVDGKAVWADSALDDRGWSTMPVPAYWDGHGYAAFDGVGWYRTTVTLDASTAARATTLAMAGVDDNDITWINGVEIGRTQGNSRPHSYRIAGGVLHAGTNTIAVRVTDEGGGGGIVAPVRLADDAGATVRDLAGVWKFRVGAVIPKSEAEHMRDGQYVNHIPTVLYNKMVHPLLPFAIKGVLWYQGESNANNDEQALAYREQFASLITSWRHEFTSGGTTLPFFWVQLPNYGDARAVPPLHESWALLRESMDAALRLPNTGQAVTIDIGEGDNIHPKNKQDAGARLARVAERVTYHEPVVASGPTYRSFTVHGRCAVVQFNDVARGLTSADTTAVPGFELAGADKKLVWANGRIVGNTVEVCSDQVSAPVAVRYAFANNPKAGLYNSEHLPAAPFRTDRW